MAYVTEDKRVKAVLAEVRDGEIIAEQARAEIKALGFLDWEVDEAMRS